MSEIIQHLINIILKNFENQREIFSLLTPYRMELGIEGALETDMRCNGLMEHC
mgnify:FL=1